jgi:hypothetical protein
MTPVAILTVNRNLGGCNNRGFSVDKHLKLDKPLGTVYMSTEASPIKVVDTAPSKAMEADKIAI